MQVTSNRHPSESNIPFEFKVITRPDIVPVKGYTFHIERTKTPTVDIRALPTLRIDWSHFAPNPA